MDTLQEKLDRSFGEGPPLRPVGIHVAAGRRALMRRRVASGAVGLAAAAVLVTSWYAVSPGSSSGSMDWPETRPPQPARAPRKPRKRLPGPFRDAVAPRRADPLRRRGARGPAGGGRPRAHPQPLRLTAAVALRRARRHLEGPPAVADDREAPVTARDLLVRLDAQQRLGKLRRLRRRPGRRGRRQRLAGPLPSSTTGARSSRPQAPASSTAPTTRSSVPTSPPRVPRRARRSSPSPARRGTTSWCGG